MVRDWYEKKGAVLGVEHLVEFEEDSITVDIPEEGTIIKGWKITPLISPVVRHPLKRSNNFPYYLKPQVTKKQVDNFREGKLTPCCQLKAEVSGRRKKIPILSHRVLLQGARRPYNFFTLELPVNGNKELASDGCINFMCLLIIDPDSQAPQTSGYLSFAGIAQI